MSAAAHGRRSNPAGSLHDRARAYDGWLEQWSLVAGGVASARFSDPSLTQVAFEDGLGDSSIWTGTYLAAEALRLYVTGSPDARLHVRQLVETLHTWFNVSGDPGMLARFAAPAGSTFPFAVSDLDCSSSSAHCNIPYDGGSWDYLGYISRDQYQGVMLGYALAYQALGDADEATRELIRGDVVGFVEELMKERTVKVHFIISGTVPLAIQQTITARFIVLATREMTDDAVVVEVDTSDYNNSTVSGFQEFTPDLSDLLKQVPLLSWLPTIPRQSSAVMLASFFRVALLVSDGVAAYAARHDTIFDYYRNHSGPGGNINDWLKIAALYADTATCGESYFANNIMMEPLYNLARLEDDPDLSFTITETILNYIIWPNFSATKNSFFSFIYAGTVPWPEASAAPTGAVQLAEFPVPPRVRVPVDLTNDPRYAARQPGCTDQVVHTTAVNVGDRPVGDFLWQRDPWELYDQGDPTQTYPGVDYLVAYWLGRRHGFIDEDAAGRCLRWQ